MKVIRILSSAVALGLAVILAACGSGSPGAGAPPNDYLAVGNGWVNYLQWDSGGTGTFTNEQLTGTPPDETVQDNQNPITVSVNGSQVEFTGLAVQTGTLGGGTLSLQVLNSDGTLGTDTFTPAAANAFNKAVNALQSVASSANSAALAQEAQASKQAANTTAENQAQSDLTTLEQDDNFNADLSKLSGDVTQTNQDLAGEQADAANGVNGGSPCYNLEDNVDYDAVDNVEYDATDDLGYDLTNGIEPDIATVHQDIANLDNDLASLKADGLPAPSGANTAVTAARQAISVAITAANSDIVQVNSDVNQAYAIGDNMATSSCSGPGGTPAPVSPIS